MLEIKNKFTRPYKSAKRGDISQAFGVLNNAYASGKHDGIDWVSSYGTFLVAPEDIYVERMYYADYLEDSTKGLDRGYGIVMRGLENPGVFHVYWHTLPVFNCKIGDTIKRGTPIAQMGNSGFVMSRGIIVPLNLRNVPPYSGTHLHQGCYYYDDGKVVYFDPFEHTDMQLPVNYDTLTTIKQFFFNITNFINK